MEKTILGVAYRHGLLTAYVRVTGRSVDSAERNAKRVCMLLEERLPETALVQVPRPRGEDGRGRPIFEVPVIIASCPEKAKRVLSKLTEDVSV